MRFRLDLEALPVEEIIDEMRMPLERLLAVTARDTLAFAAGYSGGLVLGDGSYRPRHNSYGGPPGWADKTGTLVTRYGGELITLDENTVEFVFWNDAPHARLVEAMPAGYHVVEGLQHYFVSLMDARIRELG